MPFTINTTGANFYQVALYLVDWDNKGRRLAVEMFDAKTLNLISPERVSTNFYGGKYLVYTYNKSVKFRFDQVRGDNAVLSGIFFDSPQASLPSVPILAAPNISGGNLILTGTGGTPNSGYTWLATTNLAPPVQWTTNSTGTLDGTGAFSNSLPINANQSAAFFKLEMP
jgi:hypothetical protein